MKAKNSKKQESVAMKRIRLTTAARQACRKSEMISAQAQLARAQLKTARRNFKTLKKAAKKAGKKAARCEEELKLFLKSLKQSRKRKSAKRKNPTARRTSSKKPARRAVVAVQASPTVEATAATTTPKPVANPPSPLL